MEACDSFSELVAETVGPAATLGDAMDLVERGPPIDGAILDIKGSLRLGLPSGAVGSSKLGRDIGLLLSRSKLTLGNVTSSKAGSSIWAGLGRYVPNLVLRAVTEGHNHRPSYWSNLAESRCLR